jgi:hypothetical protein
MRAGGASFGEDVALRDDYATEERMPDLGYPRLFAREDGQLVCMYYWATVELQRQHIAATVFAPPPASGGLASL